MVCFQMDEEVRGEMVTSLGVCSTGCGSFYMAMECDPKADWEVLIGFNQSSAENQKGTSAKKVILCKLHFNPFTLRF